jgi:predicted hydrocarbon binding protein
MDATGILRLATIAELLLILGSIVGLTWLFTRKPIPQYVREIAFIHSARLTTAWYLVTSATALIGTGIAANLFPNAVPLGLYPLGPGAVQLLLLAGGLLLIMALLQVARTMTPYVARVGADTEAVEAKIQRDLRAWLQTTPEEAGKIYDLHRLRDQPWRQHLTGGVSVRFHRSVLFAMKRYLEAKFGWYGSQALRETGRTVGLIVGKEWQGDTPGHRDALFRALAKEGVGMPTVLSDAPDRVVVRVDDCSESAGVETDPRFQCEFLGGFLGGILETWWGSAVQVEETRCDARGDDACEFALSAAPTDGNRVAVRTHRDETKTVAAAPTVPRHG